MEIGGGKGNSRLKDWGGKYVCVYILEMEADADAASLRSRLDAAEFPRRVAATFNYGKPSTDSSVDTLRANSHF